MPTPHAPIGAYFTDAEREWPILQSAYAEAIRDDFERIVAAIPSAELAFQWDYCTEVVNAAS